MKIVMLNPPFLPKFSRFSRSPAVTKSGTIYYPLWHAYATGLLERESHEVKLIDAPASGLSREDCYAAIRQFKPDMVVVYTSTPSIYNDIEIGGEVKNLLPETFVVLTGPHVSALPEQSLLIDERIDAVARREYDVTLCDLAKALPDRGKLDEVRGLTYRGVHGISSTPDREFIEALDSLPFVSSVYKKHLTIENYFYAHCRYPVVSIFTSRGCYGKCNYCVYPEQMFGRRQRQRSPESIVSEFEYIEEELPQVKEVLIDDDTFSFNQEHTIRFCELMLKRGIKLPWTVECRAVVKRETMVMMKKAGCRLIVVGFESADDDVLKNMKKGLTVERMKQFVEDARVAGVMIHSCFMAGNIGETRASLKKSLAFAKEIQADTCQFFPLMVYPGTEAFKWAEQNSYLTTKDFRKWLTKDGLHNCIVSTTELSSDDLMDFCDYARRAYYLNPRYVCHKLAQVIANGEERKKTLRSMKTFGRYLLKRSR
jgi:radical SAM superfamily enzyme YgiQ (UPF0313 family)